LTEDKKPSVGSLTPVPDIGPVPKEELARRRCECPKKKKKKKEARKVCYRGTYRERAKGLSKSRREQIPCK
jgi:hypothetical protein